MSRSNPASEDVCQAEDLHPIFSADYDSLCNRLQAMDSTLYRGEHSLLQDESTVSHTTRGAKACRDFIICALAGVKLRRNDTQRHESCTHVSCERSTEFAN